MRPTGPSAHLSWSELACHDLAATPYPGAWLDRALLLASEFEAIREACSRELGRPVRIAVSSAYRTAAHNREVGGAQDSQHLHGRALDMEVPRGMLPARFLELVQHQAKRRGIIRGVGEYADGHVHADVRLEDQLVVWQMPAAAEVRNA